LLVVFFDFDSGSGGEEEEGKWNSKIRKINCTGQEQQEVALTHS